MRRYFEHLKAERQAALKHTSDRSQSARYRRNYLLLMETQEVLSRPLERKMQLATIAVPVRRDAYLHYLWFLNSYARYLCYQCRRFRKAKAVLAKAFILSDKLFQMEFDRFQNQIRCFPLLIALNYARLSAISGNRDEASSQFHTLTQLPKRYGLGKRVGLSQSGEGGSFAPTSEYSQLSDKGQPSVPTRENPPFKEQTLAKENSTHKK